MVNASYAGLNATLEAGCIAGVVFRLNADVNRLFREFGFHYGTTMLAQSYNLRNLRPVCRRLLPRITNPIAEYRVGVGCSGIDDLPYHGRVRFHCAA